MSQGHKRLEKNIALMSIFIVIAVTAGAIWNFYFRYSPSPVEANPVLRPPVFTIIVVQNLKKLCVTC